MKGPSQKLRITKCFSFHMAHALYGHEGPCNNIHGHTYHLSVTLKGYIKHRPGHPEDGMLVDFTWIKKLVQKEILDVYDHALVLNADSPHNKWKDLKEDFPKLIWFYGQPTCENLLAEFVSRLQDFMRGDFELQEVRLTETPTSWAEWHRGDNL